MPRMQQKRMPTTVLDEIEGVRSILQLRISQKISSFFQLGICQERNKIGLMQT